MLHFFFDKLNDESCLKANREDTIFIITSHNERFDLHIMTKERLLLRTITIKTNSIRDAIKIAEQVDFLA